MKKFIYPINKVIKIIDGDSVRLEIDMGFKIYRHIDVRLIGIDTPETRGNSRKAGLMVRDVVEKIIMAWYKGDIPFYLESTKLDKYGRVLGEITDERTRVADFLLLEGFAKPYQGKTKSPWTEEELKSVEKLAGQFIS